MSGNDELASVVDDDESMIKYFRERIIGRPGTISRIDDSPIDDNIIPIKRTNSQNSVDDISSTDPPPNQIEKLTTAGGSGGGILSGRRSVTSSSPIIIPKKPPRSNASSQSSSSYTSLIDQASSFNESDDVLPSTLPTLSNTCQQLEHSAARDRISVKNKRRQPLKQKLSTLRENEDNNELNLFSSKSEDNDEKPPPLPPKQHHLRQPSVLLPSPTTPIKSTTKKKKIKHSLPISSTPEDDHPIPISSRLEMNKVPQPLINLADLDTTRARLRMSVRPRDRSADNILLATNTINNPITTTSTIPPEIGPKPPTPIQRSVSFKRPQEIIPAKTFNQSILKSKKKEIDDENENKINSSPTQSMSRSSSQEHIYDNLDVFKRSKPIINNDEEIVKTREHPIPTPRLRPVTMHIPPPPPSSSSNNEKQTTNEFENVFNQLKKRGSIRRTRPTEEPTPEPPPPPPPPPAVEEPPAPVPIPPPSIPEPENEQIIKPVEPTPNRRKTVGGVHLPSTNKIATDDNKPTPSWIDIAKQKHTKFQMVSNEKDQEIETEQEQPVNIRKQVPSVDNRSNRKSMFEQSTTINNTHPAERDSIRALKAGNPNRINNLIQFFDK